MLEIELPFPPSVNHYWRNFRGRTVISKRGVEFREAVRRLLAQRQVRSMAGSVMLSIQVFPPDRRRRDLDNLLKATGDALEHGGAFHDDSQITRLEVEKDQVFPGGKLLVRVTERP